MVYVYVTFELLLHAAFVTDETWDNTPGMLEPARILTAAFLGKTYARKTNECGVKLFRVG